MDRRTALHDRFDAKFHFGDPPSPVSAEALGQLETDLKTKLPASYGAFMTHHGALFTPDILTAIADKQPDRVDVREFFQPKQAVDTTKSYWSAGMPRDFIGIAGDSMGNLIGFQRQSEPSDDAPVLFFDHDFVQVSRLATSFDDFLSWYLDNL